MDKMEIQVSKVLFASNIMEATRLLIEMLSGDCPSYMVGVDIGVQCAYAASCRGVIFDYDKVDCKSIGEHMRAKWGEKPLIIYVGGGAPRGETMQTMESLRKAGYTDIIIVEEEGTTGKIPLRYSEIPIRDEDILSAISIIYRHMAHRSW